MTRTIELTMGKVAFVDDEDYDRISGFTWRAFRDRNGTYYAIRSYRRSGKRFTEYMHRAILRALPGVLVDHRNGDGLDNRRENLRLATRAQNGRNRRIDRDSTTGLKGAYFDRRSARWRASIRVDGVKVHLGCFDSAENAHAAYAVASARLHGEFGRTG